MPEEPYPADIDETTQGHPPEDMNIIDDRDPDVGKEPYPWDTENREENRDIDDNDD